MYCVVVYCRRKPRVGLCRMYRYSCFRVFSPECTLPTAITHMINSFGTVKSHVNSDGCIMRETCRLQ